MWKQYNFFYFYSISWISSMIQFPLFLVTVHTFPVVLPIVSGTELVDCRPTMQLKWKSDMLYQVPPYLLMFFEIYGFMSLETFSTLFMCWCKTFRWNKTNWISYQMLLLFEGFLMFCFGSCFCWVIFSSLSLKLEVALELYDKSSCCYSGF